MLKRFLSAAFLEPAREASKYVALLLVLLGCALILASEPLGTWLSGASGFSSSDAATKAALNSGSAILGAGVFAVIMKSAQFTTLFQERILDVFSRPVDTFGLPTVKERWQHLTDSILRSTLPSTHADASSRIRDQFLDEELEYHFEDYDIRYDIVVENGTAVIENVVRTNLVISPLHQAPVFTQEMQIDGKYEILEVRINGAPVRHEAFLTQTSADLWKFTLPLSGFVPAGRSAHDRKVEFERTYRLTQNVVREPYIMATIKRYTKGLSVHARISEDYELFFATTGLDQKGKLSKVIGSPDPQRFIRWTLAGRDELLLPGQGFVLVMLPRA